MRSVRAVRQAIDAMARKLKQLDDDVFDELDRVLIEGTYAELKDLARAEPALIRFGWSTDTKTLLFYTGDPSIADEGWKVVA